MYRYTYQHMYDQISLVRPPTQNFPVKRGDSEDSFLSIQSGLGSGLGGIGIGIGIGIGLGIWLGLGSGLGLGLGLGIGMGLGLGLGLGLGSGVPPRFNTRHV